MKFSIIEGSDRLYVRPIEVRKVGGIIEIQGKGLRSAGICECIDGLFRGKLLLYKVAYEDRVTFAGTEYVFIPLDCVMGIVELGDKEIKDGVIEVDALFGLESGWLGAGV